MSLKQKLIKSFLGVGMMKLISIPIGLATSIILARVLGPEKFGQYSFVMALIPLLALPVSGGLPQLLTREVATFVHSRDWSHYKGALRAAHVWVLLISAFILAAFWLAGSGVNLLPTEGKWSLLPIAILAVPLLGLGGVRKGALKGLGKPAYAEIPQQFIQPVLLLMFYVAAAWFGHLDTTNALWGQVAAAGIVFLIASWMFYRVRPVEATHLAPAFKLGSWGYSLVPFSLLALVSTFNTQIGIVFLGTLSSDEQVAAMRIAERGGQFVMLSLTVVNMVIAPYIVQAYRDGNRNNLQKLAQKSARGAFLLSLPVALALIIGGQKLIGLAFGKDYAPMAYWPVVIIAVGQIVNVFFGSVGHLLSMSGHERLTLVGQVVAVASNIVMSVALIPQYGAVGAALAVSISMCVWNCVLAYFVIIKLKIRPTAL